MLKKPMLGITMGDPSGIGPEIIIKALTDETMFNICRPVVLGDEGILVSARNCSGIDVSFNVLSKPSDAVSVPGKIDILPLSNLDTDLVMPGKPEISGGKAMAGYITAAVGLILDKEIDAVVTCPINKALLHEAGYIYDGHTEMIASLTSSYEYVMMLAGSKLRVSLVTIHKALKDVPSILNSDLVFKTIKITYEALKKDFGIGLPKLAVASLNPHAGESGLFGDEEKQIIIPAIDKARESGFFAEGPYPADTLFYKAVSGAYDAVIAMYHDQGLIPLKLLHFSDAVNVTLGLPVIRTSVDHGTAYDIAGTGQADPSSLKAAIKMAAAMVGNRYCD